MFCMCNDYSFVGMAVHRVGCYIQKYFGSNTSLDKDRDAYTIHMTTATAITFQKQILITHAFYQT